MGLRARQPILRANPKGACAMADPIARLEWMGKQVVCYLQPGCEVPDPAALADDICETCETCCTDAELEVAIQAVAARHHLRAQGPDRVPSDPVERLWSFGYMPPIR